MVLLGHPAGLSLLAGGVVVVDNLRFLVDGNVGSLARWLRMLGSKSIQAVSCLPAYLLAGNSLAGNEPENRGVQAGLTV